MPAPIPSIVYSDRLSIEQVLSAVGVSLRIDDSGDGVEQAAETELVNQAIYDGTRKVNMYCLGRYDASELVKSPAAWDWATHIAAAFLCRRRGNKIPKSIAEEAAEAKDELKEVQAGRLSIQDCSQRQTSLPAMSNVVVDPTCRGKKIRVQRPQSDQTPRERQPTRSWQDEFIVEP